MQKNPNRSVILVLNSCKKDNFEQEIFSLFFVFIDFMGKKMSRLVTFVSLPALCRSDDSPFAGAGTALAGGVAEAPVVRASLALVAVHMGKKERFFMKD